MVTPWMVPAESSALLLAPLLPGPLADPSESERLFSLSPAAIWAWMSGETFTPCTVPMESLALLSASLDPLEPPALPPSEEVLLLVLSSAATWMSASGAMVTSWMVPTDSSALLLAPLESSSESEPPPPPLPGSLADPLESERLFWLSPTAIWLSRSGERVTSWIVPAELSAWFVEPSEPEPPLPVLSLPEEVLLLVLPSKASWLSASGEMFTSWMLPADSSALLLAPLESSESELPLLPLPPLPGPLAEPPSERLFSLSSKATWLSRLGLTLMSWIVPAESSALLLAPPDSLESALPP